MEKNSPFRPLWSTFRKRLPFEVASSLLICFLAYYAAQNVDFPLLWKHISDGIDKRIIFGLVLSCAIFIAHGFRLKNLIRTEFYVSYQIVNIGSLLNVILPFRIGDATRIYIANRYYKINIKDLFVAVVVEKFLDLSVVLLIAATVVFFGAIDIFPIDILFVLAGMIIAAAVAYWIFRRFNLVGWIAEKMPSKLGDQFHVFMTGLAIGNRYQIAWFTCCIWVANVACTFAVFMAILPTVDFGVIDALALTVITALAVAIPGAPAGIGIFEAGVVAYLAQVHGVDGELALASALIFHAVIVVPPVVGVIVGIVKRFT